MKPVIIQSFDCLHFQEKYILFLVLNIVFCHIINITYANHQIFGKCKYRKKKKKIIIAYNLAT